MDPYLPPSPGSPPTVSKPPPVWLARLVSGVVVIAILIVAIFLGGVILVTGAVLGVALWGWLWWQRRKLMKQMGAAGAESVHVRREYRSAQRGEDFDENIIEGDFKVVDERDDNTPRR